MTKWIFAPENGAYTLINQEGSKVESCFVAERMRMCYIKLKERKHGQGKRLVRKNT